MNYRVHSYRHGVELLESVPEYQPLWAQILAAVDAISGNARLHRSGSDQSAAVWGAVETQP